MPSHDDWLVKAKSDLASSRVLLDNNCLDTSVYHTQQCAEKSLKGFLTFRKCKNIKTHDLEFLIKMCSQFNEQFMNFFQHAMRLNVYGIRFRYPDNEMFPEVQEVILAVHCAEEILEFVIHEMNK